MSGVLNFIIDGMKCLVAERKFDIPASVHEAVESFRLESDSVATFLNDRGYRPSIDHRKSLRNTYDDYVEQCHEDGSRPVSKRRLSERLRNLGYTVEKYGHDKTVMVFVERAD